MDATTALTLRCTVCGVLQEAKCSCGAAYAYISPGELAAKAVKDNPKMSSRKIAAKLGIDEGTVRGARKKSGAENSAPRVEGLDGKSYPARRKRGRPRRQNNPIAEAQAASAVIDNGKTYKEAATESGIDGSVQIMKIAAAREEGRREAWAEIGVLRDTLSMSAQERFDAAIRQATRKVERTFEAKVQTEVKTRMAVANASTQEAKNKAFEREKMYREYLQKTKKLGTLSEWNNLILCLHPDTRRTASDEKYDDAFRWVLTKKFAITGEK